MEMFFAQFWDKISNSSSSVSGRLKSVSKNDLMMLLSAFLFTEISMTDRDTKGQSMNPNTIY